MKKNKQILRVCLIILTLSLFVVMWIKYESGDFLPTTHIAIAAVEWAGSSYTLMDEDKQSEYIFVTGKWLARDDNSVAYFLHSLKGDVKKEYSVVAVSDNDNRDQLFIKTGYKIPLEGKITGGVMTFESTSYGGNFLNEKAINSIIKASENSNLQISPQVVKDDEFKFYRIYLCFDNCPVSGSFWGRVGKSNDNYIVVPQTCDETFAQDGIKVIKSDSKVFLIKDKKLKKELNKYINQLNGKPW
ncbi:MAG: hypothetical protein F8N38_06395 [Hungatella sp.]|nr:hypothetical protein [Hungatella sp.]